MDANFNIPPMPDIVYDNFYYKHLNQLGKIQYEFLSSSDRTNQEKSEEFNRKLEAEMLELNSSFLAAKVKGYILNPKKEIPFLINAEFLEKAHEKSARTIRKKPSNSDILFLLGAKSDSHSLLKIFNLDIVQTIFMLKYSLLDFKTFKYAIKINYVPQQIQEPKKESRCVIL